jgi:hypothetical protein
MTAIVVAAVVVALLTPVAGGEPRQRTIVTSPTETAATADAVRAACVNADSPECEAATQALAESVAIRLSVVGRSRQGRYRDLFRQAAGLPWPEVRAAAALGFGAMDIEASDIPILADLLNDPVSEVRYRALRALQAGSDSIGQRLASRANRVQGHSMAPDTEPSAEQVGVPIFPDASFQFYTSDPSSRRFAFATDATVDAVVKFYSGKFGPAASLDELTESAAHAFETDPAAAMAMVMEAQKVYEAAVAAGKSEQEAAEAVQRAMVGAVGLDLKAIRSRYDDNEQYGSPQVIVTAKNKTSGMPESVLVIFTDLVLKETGFVVHRQGSK